MKRKRAIYLHKQRQDSSGFNLQLFEGVPQAIKTQMAEPEMTGKQILALYTEKLTGNHTYPKLQ